MASVQAKQFPKRKRPVWARSYPIVTTVVLVATVAGGCRGNSSATTTEATASKQANVYPAVARVASNTITQSKDPAAVGTSIRWFVKKIDGRKLTIQAEGSQGCSFNDGYSVYENDRAVVIHVYRIPPDSPLANKSCDEDPRVGHAAAFTIQLRQPLGERKLQTVLNKVPDGCAPPIPTCEPLPED